MSYASSSRSRTSPTSSPSPTHTGSIPTNGQPPYGSGIFNGRHTYTSYCREIIPELNKSTDEVEEDETSHAQSVKHWVLSLPIPFPPNIPNPTLESLIPTIKYASFRVGSTFYHTDIVICDRSKPPEGIITDPTKLKVYSYDEREADEVKDGNRGEYGPPILNEEIASRLHSEPAFRGADKSGWCSYSMDHQHIYLNAIISNTYRQNNRRPTRTSTGGTPQVYLFFHVYESSRAKVLRNIDINVAAIWSDGNGDSSGRSLGKERDSETAGDIRKERERLVFAKTDAELMTMRLEECTRKAIEWEEKLLELEKKMKGVERGGRTRNGTIDNRDHAIRVDAENAIMKVHAEVQKFRDEVARYQQDDTEYRARVEAESRTGMKEEARKMMDMRKEMEQERAAWRAERAEMETERVEWRAEMETERAEWRAEMETERAEWRVEMETGRVEWRELERSSRDTRSQRSRKNSKKKFTTKQALKYLGFDL